MTQLTAGDSSIPSVASASDSSEMSQEKDEKGRENSQESYKGTPLKNPANSLTQTISEVQITDFKDLDLEKTSEDSQGSGFPKFPIMIQYKPLTSTSTSAGPPLHTFVTVPISATLDDFMMIVRYALQILGLQKESAPGQLIILQKKYSGDMNMRLTICWGEGAGRVWNSRFPQRTVITEGNVGAVLAFLQGSQWYNFIDVTLGDFGKEQVHKKYV